MKRNKPKTIENDYLLFMEEHLSKNSYSEEENKGDDSFSEFLGDYDYNKYLEEEDDK